MVVEVARVHVHTAFCIVRAGAVVVGGHGVVVVGSHVGAAVYFIHVTHAVTVHICNAVSEAVVACCGHYTAAIVDGRSHIVVAGVGIRTTHFCAACEVT